MPGTRDVGSNIKELREHGSRPRSRDQILAIALSEARKAGNSDVKPAPKKKHALPKGMFR